MFGEPDGVVAGLVHDGEAFERRLVDRIERHGAIAPAEELQNADFHFPSLIRVPLTPSERLQDYVQCVLDPALHFIIVGKGCDKFAQPMDPECGEVEWIEHVTLPPDHKPWRDARVLAGELRHRVWPHEGCDDPGRHPGELIRLEHDDKRAHRTRRGSSVHAELRRRYHRFCISSDRLPCAS